jgi:hypothetical protein
MGSARLERVHRVHHTGFCEPTIQPPYQNARAPTPLNSDDEDAFMTEDQKRAQASARKRAQKEGLPAPSRFEGTGKPAQSSTQMSTRSKAKETKGKEGDQRVSEEQVPVTVRRANRAGGLRSAVGSGSVSTCVAKGHPL